jgi:undecaprenyl-diphosphatase
VEASGILELVDHLTGRPEPGALLPGRWRELVAVLVPLSAIGAAVLGVWFAGTRRAGPLDRAVDGRMVAHLGPHEGLLWPISDLGSPPVLPLGVLALALAAVAIRRGWSAVALAVAGPLAAVLLAELMLKPLVGRTHEGGLALPSGHTTSIAALAWVFVLMFVAGGTGRLWLRVALVGLAVLAVLGVAASMVALERHYATDTVAGALVATAVVGTVALLLDAWERRRTRRSSAERKSG